MKDRYLHLDVIRGLAICSMVAANSAPYFLAEPHPFWFRLIGTFAAPFFICITGYLLGRSKFQTKLSTNKTLVRGLLTLLVASLIDVFIWNTMPFTTFDVLYLIGFGICLFPLYSKLNKWALLILILVILVVPQLIFINEYRPGIPEIILKETPVSSLYHSWQALFLDGWFPVFPWIGLMMLASWTGYYFPEPADGKNQGRKIAVGLLFLLGIIFLFYQQKITRNGYSELFYPPDLMYMIVAVSILCLVWLNRAFFNHRVFIPVSWLGRSSLFFYILHSVFIQFLLPDVFSWVGENYGVLLLLFLISLLMIAFILVQLKKQAFWKKMPLVLRFLMGN